MIELHQYGVIHEVRMARPPVNALDDALLEALAEAVRSAPARGAQALVLSSGQKAFSGGLDVPYLMTLDRQGLAACWWRFFEAARAIARLPVPVVAAVTGHSPAGGCVLALCCDYRVMARGPVRIGLNETQVGLAVPDAIQHLMRRIVGPYRAERLVVSGTMVESEQALALGLVDELTDAEHVGVRARHWLDELLALPRSPMLATRSLARADLVAALDAFGQRELEGFLDGWHSPDTQAALQALVARLKK